MEWWYDNEDDSDEVEELEFPRHEYGFLLKLEPVNEFFREIFKLKDFEDDPSKSKIIMNLDCKEIRERGWTKKTQPRHLMKGLLKTRSWKDSHGCIPSMTIPNFFDDLVIESWDTFFVSVERNKKKAAEKEAKRKKAEARRRGVALAG